MSPLTDLFNLGEFEDAARAVLPREVYDYYAGGAEDEQTIRANRAAFARHALLPRTLVDVSHVDTSIELFGTTIRSPTLIAPTAFHMLAHPEAEAATARAAAECGTIFVASTVSTLPIETIAQASGANIWFQLYVFKDRDITVELVRRAEAAGCQALCLTVTVPVQGKRERDARNRFRLPEGMEMANFVGLRQAQLPAAAGSGLEAFIASEFDASLRWDAVEWLASLTSLPVLLKGVCHPGDARLACEHGAAGIIVSNHGGRQLDAAIATLDALPGVLEATAGRVPVLLDGGIRRGTDVLKAMALGAAATLIGRPALFGLAVDGEAGVRRVLQLLQEELERALALCGQTRIRDVRADLLVAARSAPGCA
jgi:isopentenyl diphosphate isomerase/L-lactate dehydrogenase-like FMN-dependent dehydrogenase